MTITQQQIERLTLLMKRNEIAGEYSLRHGDVHLSNQKKRIADDLRAAIETLEKHPGAIEIKGGGTLFPTLVEVLEYALWVSKELVDSDALATEPTDDNPTGMTDAMLQFWMWQKTVADLLDNSNDQETARKENHDH